MKSRSDSEVFWNSETQHHRESDEFSCAMPWDGAQKLYKWSLSASGVLAGQEGALRERVCDDAQSRLGCLSQATQGASSISWKQFFPDGSAEAKTFCSSGYN